MASASSNQGNVLSPPSSPLPQAICVTCYPPPPHRHHQVAHHRRVCVVQFCVGDVRPFPRAASVVVVVANRKNDDESQSSLPQRFPPSSLSLSPSSSSSSSSFLPCSWRRWSPRYAIEVRLRSGITKWRASRRRIGRTLPRPPNRSHGWGGSRQGMARGDAGAGRITTMVSMSLSLSPWQTHTHFWPRGGSHQVTHLALTLWLMQDWGGLTCKDEQRMGGADDSSWGWLWWRPLLTLWLFFSLLCSIVFVKFWRDDQHRKPTVFFNGERLLGELARFWWIKLFPIVFWWGFELPKTNLVRLKKF